MSQQSNINARRITIHQKPTFNLLCQPKQVEGNQKSYQMWKASQYQDTLSKIMERNFYLDKRTFWDSTDICYDIPLKYLPSRCFWSDIQSRIWPFLYKGRFHYITPQWTLRFTVNQLLEIFHEVRLEPQLRPPPPRWNPPWRGEGAYPTKRFSPQCINKWSSSKRCGYVR